MTEYKLVPVEPTPEMLEAAFGSINYCEPDPSEHAGRVYSAMLSAAPSPDGVEDEVERVARALCEANGGEPSQDVSWVADDGRRLDPWETFLSQARAAIAAMRPTETHVRGITEDGAEALRLIRERDRRDTIFLASDIHSLGLYAAAHKDRAFLLSLIDKLAGEG